MIITDILSKWVDNTNLRCRHPYSEYDRLLPQFDEDSGIEKNIFQIYLRGDDLSREDAIAKLTPDFTENIERLKSNNPGFNYQLYSDKEAKQFVLQYYGETMWEYYQRIDNAYLAAKADLLRYLLLYAFGGVYLDLKSTVECPLSKTLRDDDRFLVFYWDIFPEGQHHDLVPDYIVKGEMLQTFIVAAKGHPFLRKVILSVLRQIDQYNPYRDGVGWAGTLTTVGPIIYTKTIYEEITHSMDSSVFREGKPWEEFGFKFYFAGDYTPGIYQQKLSMKDYRKSSRPVIVCKRHWLQTINIWWMKILHIYRRICKVKK